MAPLLPPLLLLVSCRPPGPATVDATVDATDSAAPPDSAPTSPSDTGVGGTGDGGAAEPEEPEHVGEYHPGQGLYTDDEVHQLALTLDDTSWDSLIAAPTTYAAGTLDIDGRSLEIGVRLKGNTSFQPLTGTSVATPRTTSCTAWCGMVCRSYAARWMRSTASSPAPSSASWSASPPAANLRRASPG